MFMPHLKSAIVLALLLFQVVMIAYARFVPSRYFCWAPYDMQTDYQLEITVNGSPLTPAEIRQRYRRSARGTDNRSVQHLIDIIEQSEKRYGAGDSTQVFMRYRVNGKEEEEWRWPNP
jgi:hypothetical protein